MKKEKQQKNISCQIIKSNEQMGKNSREAKRTEERVKIHAFNVIIELGTMIK